MKNAEDFIDDTREPIPAQCDFRLEHYVGGKLLKLVPGLSTAVCFDCAAGIILHLSDHFECYMSLAYHQG